LVSLNTALLTRRLAASARLAALYLSGVVVLVVPFEWARELPAASQLRDFVTPLVIIFVIAFALLALARRAGFAALWLTLVAMWTSGLASGHSVFSIPNAFFFWSLLALPLFAIGALGTKGAPPLVATRWPMPAPWIVLAVWIVLLATAFHWRWVASDVHFPDTPYEAVAVAARFVWAPAPFVIAVLEIARVWVATRPTKGDAKAA
jgi:hypothetical protein